MLGVDKIGQNISLMDMVGHRIQEIHDKGYVISGENEIIARKVVDLLSLKDKSTKNKIVPVCGLPGGGKGGLLKGLARYLQIKLKKQIGGNQNELQLGYVHKNTNTHTLYVTLDAFFKEIGAGRRTKMLESKDNFLDMFSDNEKAVNFISNYLNTSDSFCFNGAYLKTDKERAANAAMSKFNISGKKDTKGTLVFLDGVNSHIISDILEQKFNKLEIFKIMIYPRIELALQRNIRRDHVSSITRKGKPIKDIIKFRMKENYYNLIIYIMRVLTQNNVTMVDFTPNTVHDITKKEIITTSRSVQESQDELLAEELGDYFDEYINDNSELLLEHFNYLLKFRKYFIVDRYDDTKIETLKGVDVSFEELAEKIGNLYYDSLSEFLSLLSDGLKSNKTQYTLLKSISNEIWQVWEDSEPYMDLTKTHYKHTSEVKGIGMGKETLASLVSKLTDDKLKEFLLLLSKKLKKDSIINKEKGRPRLSSVLSDSASELELLTN